jgi:hypothetical protein
LIIIERHVDLKFLSNRLADLSAGMAEHRHLRLVEIGEDADAALKEYGTLPG